MYFKIKSYVLYVFWCYYKLTCFYLIASSTLANIIDSVYLVYMAQTIYVNLLILVALKIPGDFSV